MGGAEKVRLRRKPSSILLDYQPIGERSTGQGFDWKPMERGGVLIVRRDKGNKVLVLK